MYNMYQKNQRNIFNLSNLNALTHEKIDKALKSTLLSSPFIKSSTHLNYTFSFFNKEDSLQTPYQRVYELINTRNKSKKQIESNLRVLSNLLGGSDEESLQLDESDELLTAVRIFVKFKSEGNNYRSQNGNTSLHHAILCCPTYKDALTSLLIQNGANPEITNNKNQTASILYIERFLPKAVEKSKKLILKYGEPHEQLVLLTNIIINSSNSEIAFEYLKVVQLYELHHRNPEMFSFSFPADEHSHTILHNAAIRHSDKIVHFLLSLGANPDVLDRSNYKPIHHAVIRAMTCNSIEMDTSLKIIALLLVSSLYQSYPKDQPPTADDYIEALLELSLTKKRLRFEVCQLLSQLIRDDSCSYQNLCNILNVKLLELEHREIYKIRPIAKGSHGVICEGIMKNSNGMPEPVAIKHNISIYESPAAQFEATLLRNFNHPNIVKYICHIERPDIRGFVMEFANQGTLNDFVMHNKIILPEEYLLSVIQQINVGLGYIHGYNLVHLDLTLKNILVHNLKPLITDFGAAALKGDTRPYPVTTVSYCAPEGFDFKTPYCSSRDIFSLGVLVKEIMTKQYAWEEIAAHFKNEEDLYLYIKSAVTQGGRSNFNNTILPIPIEKIVDACLKQSPLERPNCEQIDSMLEELSENNGSLCK